jgi:hypothetical protein
MLPEEDVPMPFHRLGLRRWFRREVADPLTAMYAGIDERLQEGAEDPGAPQPPITPKRSPASE